MKRDWKPGDGDVAVVSWQSKSGRHGGTQLAMRCSDSYDESHWQSQSFGVIADDTVTAARPLIVIDVEDREQVRALVAAIGGMPFPFDVRVDDAQAALREFADPTPPRPDEPTAIWSVVVDADDDHWVRILGPDFTDGWVRAGDLPSNGKWTDYADIAAVKVLSDGVQS